MKGLGAQEGGVRAAVEEPGPVTPLGSISTHGAAAVIPRNVSFRPFGLGQRAHQLCEAQGQGGPQPYPAWP